MKPTWTDVQAKHTHFPLHIISMLKIKEFDCLCRQNLANTPIIVDALCVSSPEPPKPEIQSAFRAVRNATNPNITIPANTSIQVLYPNEQYDLRNEYNTLTSTFIPATKGVYSIIASVEFIVTPPPTTPTDYRVLISILVNNILQ